MSERKHIFSILAKSKSECEILENRSFINCAASPNWGRKIELFCWLAHSLKHTHTHRHSCNCSIFVRQSYPVAHSAASTICLHSKSVINENTCFAYDFFFNPFISLSLPSSMVGPPHFLLSSFRFCSSSTSFIGLSKAIINIHSPPPTDKYLSEVRMRNLLGWKQPN